MKIELDQIWVNIKLTLYHSHHYDIFQRSIKIAKINDRFIYYNWLDNFNVPKNGLECELLLNFHDDFRIPTDEEYGLIAIKEIIE